MKILSRLFAILVLFSILIVSCKKESSPPAANPTIVGKWARVKNIDWYTNLNTNVTVKDTTTETHDVTIDFQSNGTYYQKVWDETNSDYIYDTAYYNVSGTTLTLTGSDLTLTDPYSVEVESLTSTNLTFHSVDTVSNYRDENWDFMVKQ